MVPGSRQLGLRCGKDNISLYSTVIILAMQRQTNLPWLVQRIG